MFRVTERTIRRGIDSGKIRASKDEKGRITASVQDIEVLYSKKTSHSASELELAQKEQIQFLKDQVRQKDDLIGELSETIQQNGQATLIMLKDLQDTMKTKSHKLFGLIPIRLS